MSKSSMVAVMVVACLGSVQNAELVEAASITSAPFSFGYGYTPAASWNDSETFALNTPTTQGNFTFVPTVTSSGFDGSGPIFTGRNLTSGGVDFSAISIDYPGGYAGLTASIAASYTGPAPLDAAPVPNYQIQLNINQISIYGSNYAPGPPAYTAETLAFTETTAGHLSTSPSISLVSNAPASNANFYNQLVWDPTDYAEDGASFTRTFRLLSEDAAPVDGFEVFGTVTLLYDAALPAPEPSSLLLMGLGTMLLSMRRRRNRR